MVSKCCYSMYCIPVILQSIPRFCYTGSHRLGQKRTVRIYYFDAVLTVDPAMKEVNIMKEANAQVLLADGTSLGSASLGSYTDLAGIMGESVKSIRALREALIASNAANGDGDAPLICDDDSDLREALKKKIAAREEKERKPASGSSSQSDSDSGSDSGDDSDDELLNGGPVFGAKKVGGSVASSDDDSDDDLLNAGPTFGARARANHNK